MTGIAFLLFLILNHMVHSSIKDCLKFYLKKYIKQLEGGILTFISTYFLSLLILYIFIGVFMLIFTNGFYFEDFFRPKYYFRELLDFQIMENDPDIIRWSQLKKVLIHFAGWALVYFIIGWANDLTYKFYQEDIIGVEGWEVVWLWLGLSAICTPMTLTQS